jgi:hypothetical protein
VSEQIEFQRAVKETLKLIEQKAWALPCSEYLDFFNEIIKALKKKRDVE